MRQVTSKGFGIEVCARLELNRVGEERVCAGGHRPAGQPAVPRTLKRPPSIEFTRLPPAGEGSPEIIHTIEGRVKAARPHQRMFCSPAAACGGSNSWASSPSRRI